MEGGCTDAQGLAEGQDRVSISGCWDAPAVADWVDAAEHPHGLRSVPDRISEHPLDPWRKVVTWLAITASIRIACLMRDGFPACFAV